MKTLDLTVLFIDSVPSRIYLALLHKSGCRAKNIIFLDIQPKSAKYNFVKRLFGISIASFLYSIYRKIRSKALDSIAIQLLALNNLKPEDLNNCLAPYDKKEIEKLYLKNMHDEKLSLHIERGSYGAILFTGGGILKDKILDIPEIKFIHIHPGIVPDIRGADCLFWSYLLRNKAGYSAFYMNSGIDTGDILIKKEYDIEFGEIDFSSSDNYDIYMNILMYYDPCLRINTFIELLNSVHATQRLDDLHFERQDPNEGRMYFFMHKELRDFVINKMKRA